jgi:hypothetical protein
MYHCAWLFAAAWNDRQRPDRVHVVIDAVVDPSPVTITSPVTGETFVIDLITAWCDPAYPSAFRQSPVKEMLMDMAQESGLAINVQRGLEQILIFTGPAAAKLKLDPNGWHEVARQHLRDAEWRPEQVWEKDALALGDG